MRFILTKNSLITMNRIVKNIIFLLILIRNGGSSCSIFCMCVMLLDQLKNEHAVDVFQRVRALQRQRVAMITSLVCRIK